MSIAETQKGQFLLIGIKTKAIIVLILLGIIDGVVPLPIIGIVLIFILLTRPPWFRNAILKIYNESGRY